MLDRIIHAITQTFEIMIYGKSKKKKKNTTKSFPMSMGVNAMRGILQGEAFHSSSDSPALGRNAATASTPAAAGEARPLLPRRLEFLDRLPFLCCCCRRPSVCSSSSSSRTVEIPRCKTFGWMRRAGLLPGSSSSPASSRRPSFPRGSESESEDPSLLDADSSESDGGGGGGGGGAKTSAAVSFSMINRGSKDSCITQRSDGI